MFLTACTLCTGKISKSLNQLCYAFYRTILTYNLAYAANPGFNLDLRRLETTLQDTYMNTISRLHVIKRSFTSIDLPFLPIDYLSPVLPPNLGEANPGGLGACPQKND
jgi:hypothetical protein